MRHASRFSMLGFLLVLPLLSQPGCKKNVPPPPPAPAVDAAIVTDADVLIRADFASIRKSSINNKMKSLQDTSRLSEAQDPYGILKASGIGENDINCIVASATVAKLINFSEFDVNLESIQMAMAIEIQNPTSLDKLKGAIASTEKATVTQIQMDGKQVLKIGPMEDPDTPIFAALSNDGKTIFLALNESSIKNTLQRAGSGKMSALSAAMAAMDKRQPVGSQVQVAFVVPEELRQAMKEEMQKSAKNSGGMGYMMASMLQPFQNMKNLSLSGVFGKNIDFRMSTEFGSADDAVQVAGIFPMAGMMLQAQSGSQGNIMDRLSVTNMGPVLQASFSLTEDDITKMSEEASKARASAQNWNQSGRKAAPPEDIAAPEVQPQTTVINTDETPEKPVEAVPADPVRNDVAAPVADWAGARKKLKIGGTMTGKTGKTSAFVNNNVVSAGDTVTVTHDQMVYRWKVKSIAKQDVQFDQLDAKPE